MGPDKRDIPAFHFPEDVFEVFPELIEACALGHVLGKGFHVSDPQPVFFLPVDNSNGAHRLVSLIDESRFYHEPRTCQRMQWGAANALFVRGLRKWDMAPANPSFFNFRIGSARPWRMAGF